MPDSPLNQSPFSVEAWLAEWLETTPAIRDVVGKMVFPLVIPQAATLPAITYQRVGTPREYHLRGQSESVLATFHVKIYGRSNVVGYKTNIAAAKAIRNAVSGLQTDAKDSGNGLHYIEHVQVADEQDDIDEPVFADDVATFIRWLTITVKHYEEPPSLIGGG